MQMFKKTGILPPYQTKNKQTNKNKFPPFTWKPFVPIKSKDTWTISRNMTNLESSQITSNLS